MTSKDKYFMDIAIAVARASKCVKAQYGAVIVDKNGHIVGTGYNGKPQGSINDSECYRLKVLPNSEKSPCCLHAEANAIVYTDRSKTEGGTLYVNVQPCEMCALSIMQAGIKRLVYLSVNPLCGHIGSSTDDFWARYGSKVERVCLDVPAELGAHRF